MKLHLHDPYSLRIVAATFCGNLYEIVLSAYH